MTETDNADTDDLSEQLEYLMLYMRHLEDSTLTPTQTLWLLASRYLLSASGIAGGIMIALIWVTEGRAAAFAIGESFIHITIATLMVVGAIISIVGGLHHRLERRSAHNDQVEAHSGQDTDE
jgi:hypothetical protein